MGCKALLVYPEMPPTYWSMRYAMRFVGKRASFPPLGLLTVAALMPPDYEVSLVDMNVEPLTDAALASADLVLTSSMLVQRESHERLVRRCKALGKTVVAGGPYPSSTYQKIEGVDHFVLNEAETTLPPFLEDHRLGRARRVYSDTAKPDLSRTPPPRFDLAKTGRYATMALQYSRGCPHDCEFCDIIEMFGRVPRVKAPEQFLEEMRLLYATGGRGSLFVVDDNFIGNRREVKKLLPLVAAFQRERGYPFTLFTEATLGLAEDDALMDMMVAAGFNMVFLGIETPDRCTLQATGKGQNLRSDMLESVRRIQAKGMEVTGGFIVGFDTDPEDIFERQIRFIQEAAIPTAMVGLLSALPGTRLHRRLESEGRLTRESGGNNTHDLRLNFVPKMDLGRLLEGYKRVLKEIYKPDRYFDRCLGLLRTMPRHETSARTVRWTELRAFALSLLIQTFSPYGWPYWKFLVRGTLSRPTMIAETVTMAVKGHHFFKMTKNVLAVDRFKGALDRLARAFEERASGIPATELAARLAELTEYRDRALARMRSRYRRIHRDFRSYADEALASFQSSLDEMIERLSAEAARGASA